MARGMTLVELLVVVAIMVLLLAVSVPILRPVLESQKTSSAARVLEGAFQQARAKAMYEQQSYGVRLLPFDNAPAAVIELRVQKRSVSNFPSPARIRVKVVNGFILPHYFNEMDGLWTRVNWSGTDPAEFPPDLQPELTLVREHFLQSTAVQFNRTGRSFTFAAVTDEEDSHGNQIAFQLLYPYDTLNLPEDPSANDALEYLILRPAGAAMDWMPPLVMPRGTIVDIAFSGGETVNFDGNPKTDDDIPASFPPGTELFIEFSPAGHVDRIHADGHSWKVNEMLYFCVGDWDRQVDINGKSLAEDSKTNLEVPATYWVMLHPKTGTARVTENAPFSRETRALPENDPEEAEAKRTAMLRDARKFASEHFFNVGGN